MNKRIRLLDRHRSETREHIQVEAGDTCDIFISDGGLVQFVTPGEMVLTSDELAALIEALQMGQRQQKEIEFLAQRKV